MLGAREAAQPGAQGLRDVARAGHGHEAAAAGPLRRADQVLGAQQAQRLPDRRAADAVLLRQVQLVRETHARQPRPVQDLRAQALGDDLVRLQIPNSPFPATETGADDGTSPRPEK